MYVIGHSFPTLHLAMWGRSAGRSTIGGMVTMEIHAGEGGTDAEMFAAELAAAVAKHFNRPVERAGRVLLLHRL